MRLAPAFLLVLAAALFVAACGDDDGGSDAGASETPNLFPAQPVPQEQPDPAQELDATLTEPVDGVIEVALTDVLFSPNNLHVPLGQSVTIQLTNNDPAAHTMRVAGIDGRYDTEDDAVVPEIAPGAVEELTLDGATEGTFTFRCDLHPGTMGGVIVVE